MRHADEAMTDLPKYSALEIERRWLVDAGAVGDLNNAPFRLFDDIYIEKSRLRLRKITMQSGEVVFKLGKKYGKRSRLVEPITTLYLDEAEYIALSSLPGVRISKKRFSIAGGSLDVFTFPSQPISIFELEFESVPSAESYVPPGFVTREVTGDPNFSGHSLARKHAA